MASPALPENIPWAVPPSDVGSLDARTVTPPTKAQANPVPSSGAISTSAIGSVDECRERRPEQEGAGPEHEQPLRRRSVAPSRGKRYISGTSMTAPNAQVKPTRPVLPPSATIWIE